MIAALLGLLGLGGVATAIAWFVIPGAQVFLLGVLRAIPREVWYGLVAILALVGIWLWHRDAVSDARDEGYAAGSKASDAAWGLAFNEAARKAKIYKDGFLAASKRETDALRSKTDETLRANAVVADDLRVRGPGRAAAPAVCRSGDGTLDPRTADRPGAPGGGSDAPLAPVPPDQPLALVPWVDLVRFGEQHDRYRTERNTLIEHIDDQNRRLDVLRAQLAAAVPDFTAR